MTRKEQCLDDMLKGVPWKTLISKYPKSTVYESIKEYEKITEKEYQETTHKKADLTKEVQDLQTTINKQNHHIQDLKQTEATLLDRISGLENRETEIKELIKEIEERLGVLEAKIAEMETRGITIENLTAILDTDIDSLKDLLARIKTSKEYNALRKDVNKLEQSLETLQSKIEKDTRKLTELRKDIMSEKNRLAHLQSEYVLLQDSIEIIDEALREGFTPGIIRGLMRALLNLSIRKEPLLSAKILLNKLENTKEDLELDRSISAKRKELSVLKQELAELRATLRTLRNNVVKTINEVQSKGIASLEQSLRSATENIHVTKNQCIDVMKRVEQTTLQSMANIEKSSRTNINQLNTAAQNSLYNLHIIIKSAFTNYESQIKKWGNMRETIGNYTSLINQASLILGILQTPKDVLKLNLSTVVQVAERLHLYIVKRFPDEKTYAPKEVTDTEWAISSIYQAYLSSISKWLLTDLQERLGRDSQ